MIIIFAVWDEYVFPNRFLKRDFQGMNCLPDKMTEAKNRMINLLSIFGGGRNTGYDLNTK